jgi:hypothetical protein
LTNCPFSHDSKVDPTGQTTLKTVAKSEPVPNMYATSSPFTGYILFSLDEGYWEEWLDEQSSIRRHDVQTRRAQPYVVPIPKFVEIFHLPNKLFCKGATTLDEVQTNEFANTR